MSDERYSTSNKSHKTLETKTSLVAVSYVVASIPLVLVEAIFIDSKIYRKPRFQQTFGGCSRAGLVDGLRFRLEARMESGNDLLAEG